MANTAITRSISSGTTVNKFTLSMWIKRGVVSANYPRLFTSNGGTGDTYLRFNNDDTLEWSGDASNASSAGYAITTRLFRDPSAWYHIVIRFDSTQSSASDRLRIYVNGTQEESFSTYTDVNLNATDKIVDTSKVNRIGGNAGSADSFFDGSMSQINFIDGTSYPATAFGSVNATSGIWVANSSPTVTYGNNGFFLDMANSSDMGNDVSGNANDFTVGSGTVTQMEDTPDNNFATLNPVYKSLSQPTFANGNLSSSASGAGYRLSFSTIAVSTGKYYAEFYRAVGSTDEVFIGISSLNDAENLFNVSNYYLGETAKSISISSGNGKYYISASGTTYGSSYLGSGDIIGVALDLTNKKLYASKNGAWSNGSGAWSSTTFNASTGAIDISSIISSGEYAYIGFSNTGTSTVDANFGNGYFGTTPVSSAGTNASGNGIFEYDTPTGYTALSTKGLNL